MRALLLLVMPALALAADDSVAWHRVLESIGCGDASVRIVEGSDPALGIQETSKKISVRHIVDKHSPEMPIIWGDAVETSVFSLPGDFEVFASDKWTGAPVLAGKRSANRPLIWTATPIGETGMERYPYIPQALLDLGLEPQMRSNQLWAFFDGAYRSRADLNYLAARWRKSGISALHVAAWHNMEPDAQRDDFLNRLITACHRNAILVYAWLELPHVSDVFWDQHPEWREKTAIGQDAQLDWRKLMDLSNADCRKAAAYEVTGLLNRFDWDGVNLAELYFESLEGPANPARFTPMNKTIRDEFREIAGFDPALLFDASSPYAKDADAMRKFLDFRVVLASRLQNDWLKIVRVKPDLDVVLTHIDDRFDKGVHDELGVDVTRTIRATRTSGVTIMIEDPATLWNLGSERYAKIAEQYKPFQPAIDINVVERYQDVYPTKKQTGAELFELIHQASESFPRVALYFEQSIEKTDLPLIPYAAANQNASHWVRTNELWPIESGGWALVPASRQVSATKCSVILSDFNGDLQSVSESGIAYRAKARAIAVLAQEASIAIDGKPYMASAHGTVMLPSGEHKVTFTKP